MARDESDREDLLREATALVERIELSPPISAAHAAGTVPRPAQVRDRERDSASATHESTAENVVIGFRANGAVSIFFGTDPVYQFNATGELRRAYSDGLLYKAARHRLVSLRRVRQPGEVQLLRRDLTDSEQQAFIATMQGLLHGLADDLKLGRRSVVGQVPAEADVLRRVRDWLAAHNEPMIAATPRV